MHDFTKLLKEELITALGCTEPIAVALAAAKAKDLLEEEAIKAELYVSGNIIKNVKGVTVPNSNGMKGLESAVALGIIGGDFSKDLEVLTDVTDEDIEKAKKFIAEDKITVILKKGVENLDIEVVLYDKDNNTAEVEIKNKHNNIISIRKKGEVLKSEKCESVYNNEIAEKLNIDSIYEYATTIDLSEVKDMLQKQISFNSAIAEEGIKNNWGVCIGKQEYKEDPRSKARALAAAGSDARMSGCSLPVVINAGSGNQGITCCIPVIVYAEFFKSSEEDLYRALLISNLTALHIKKYIGRLSAFCGVTTAGTSAAAAIAYLDSKDINLVKNTISNSLMILSGMLCDGAKPSCAAKISQAVDAGITGYIMAKGERNFKNGEGLVMKDVEETIKGIGYVASHGMKETDINILELMIKK